MEKLKYVSPDYKARLDELARSLVIGRNFGGAALQTTVELGVPDNVVLGQE